MREETLTTSLRIYGGEKEESWMILGDKYYIDDRE